MRSSLLRPAVPYRVRSRSRGPGSFVDVRAALRAPSVRRPTEALPPLLDLGGNGSAHVGQHGARLFCDKFYPGTPDIEDSQMFGAPLRPVRAIRVDVVGPILKSSVADAEISSSSQQPAGLPLPAWLPPPRSVPDTCAIKTSFPDATIDVRRFVQALFETPKGVII